MYAVSELFFLKIYHLFHNLESGLDPVKFITLQTMNTFIDSSQTRMVLKYTEDDLDTAFRDTVEATSN